MDLAYLNKKKKKKMLTESFDHPEPLSFQAFSWRKMH